MEETNAARMLGLPVEGECYECGGPVEGRGVCVDWGSGRGIVAGVWPDGTLRMEGYQASNGPEGFVVDLTDRTSRAHAAWWCRRVSRDQWPEVELRAAIEAEMGTDMADAQIATLRGLVLRGLVLRLHADRLRGSAP